jgi:competence protein ComGC
MDNKEQTQKEKEMKKQQEQMEINNYLIQMNESQKKAYLIAKDHLGTSFNILKSNGFIEWKNSIFKNIPFKKV